MHNKNTLILSRGLFIIIIIVAFGLIIMNEKGGELFKTKIDKKINEYLETHYKDSIENANLEEITYDNNTFTKKIVSKQNKNLYFYIQYKNKEIKDTYQEDYEEGKTLLDYIDKKLEKEIKSKAKIDCTVESINTLNNYSEKVQERNIKEDNLLQLKFLIIKKEIEIDNWTKEEITKEIVAFIETVNNKDITPKYYEITINNPADITTSIIISNITEDFLKANNKEQIIEDIINKKETQSLKDSNLMIKYEN